MLRQSSSSSLLLLRRLVPNSSRFASKGTDTCLNFYVNCAPVRPGFNRRVYSNGADGASRSSPTVYASGAVGAGNSRSRLISRPQQRTDLDAKADKAISDLKDLIDKRQRKIDEYNARTWGETIGHFARSSRSQLINLAAAFACVLLAVQLVNARAEAGKSRGRIEDDERTIHALRETMFFLKDGQFASDVAGKVLLALEKQQGKPTQFDAVDRSRSERRFFGLIRRYNTATKNNMSVLNTNSTDGLELVIASVIRKELQQVIGNAVQSESEKKEMEVERLQSFAKHGNSFDDALNPAAKELLDLADEQEKYEGDVTIVKKKKFMF